MKILSWLVGLPFAVIVVVFALSNRGGVALAFWPFEEGLNLPVYLAVLAPLLVGFVLGFAMASVRGVKHRVAARRHAKRVAVLEQELERAAPSTVKPAEIIPPSEDQTRS